jgi:hypothetical protein
MFLNSDLLILFSNFPPLNSRALQLEAQEASENDRRKEKQKSEKSSEAAHQAQTGEGHQEEENDTI